MGEPRHSVERDPHGRRPTQATRLGVVLEHLALVAIDGAGDSVMATLDDGFRLHLDGITTDATGYLVLLSARWAAEGDRPPLDVMATSESGDMVTVSIEPHCLAHVRVIDGRIRELWLTADWRQWVAWLHTGELG